MAHTPGPWAVEDTSIVSEEHCIAVIEDDGGYEAPSDERRANARLIVAAPDLLAACKAFVGHYSGNVNPDLNSAFVSALDAIAKAEGATP